MAGVQEVTVVLVAEGRGRSASWALEVRAPPGIPKTVTTSSPKLTASRNQEAESQKS